MLREKVAASTFARGYLTGMVSSVLDSLWDQGFFYDPVEREVIEDFMPWLSASSQAHLDDLRTARAAVVALVTDALHDVAASEAAADNERRAANDAAEAAAAKIAAAHAAAEQAELDDVRGKATFIFESLVPRCVGAAQVC